jgi:hypothetical protein
MGSPGDELRKCITVKIGKIGEIRRAGSGVTWIGDDGLIHGIMRDTGGEPPRVIRVIEQASFGNIRDVPFGRSCGDDLIPPDTKIGPQYLALALMPDDLGCRIRHPLASWSLFILISRELVDGRPFA